MLLLGIKMKDLVNKHVLKVNNRRSRKKFLESVSLVDFCTVKCLVS